VEDVGFNELEADFKARLQPPVPYDDDLNRPPVMQAVLDQLQADPALSRFRNEYEKIHDGKDSHHDFEVKC
jgi:hypothetical protein